MLWQELHLGPSESLSLKTVILVAVFSAKWAGNLSALSVHQSCLTFSNDNRGVLTLHSNLRQQQQVHYHFSPPAFQSEEDERLNILCPVCALSIYVERTRAFWHSNQLFVSYGPQTRERLSHWILEAIITLAYSNTGQDIPYSECGYFLGCLCAAASWRTPHTFCEVL